jgi:hypothetical protein
VFIVSWTRFGALGETQHRFIEDAQQGGVAKPVDAQQIADRQSVGGESASSLDGLGRRPTWVRSRPCSRTSRTAVMCPVVVAGS